LRRGLNADIGRKDFFEMASNEICHQAPIGKRLNVCRSKKVVAQKEVRMGINMEDEFLAFPGLNLKTAV